MSIQITPDGDGYGVVLDGRDLSHLLVADGVEVAYREDPVRRYCAEGHPVPTVTLTVTLSMYGDTAPEVAA